MNEYGYQRIIYSLLTVYSTTVCLLFTVLWSWGGYITYLSPMISIIASVKYFGFWQQNMHGTLPSVIICGFFGCVIGACFQYITLHIILTFFGFAWIERTNLLSQKSKSIGLICMLLGIISPVLNNDLTIISSFSTILLLLLIPLVITGITLMYPCPQLASTASRGLITKICDKTKILISAQVKAYRNHRYADLYNSEIDNALNSMRPDIDLILQFAEYVEFEAVLFVELKDLAPSIRRFVHLIRNIMVHTQLQQVLIRRIVNNHTHRLLSYHMDVHFVELEQKMNESVDIISHYFQLHSQSVSAPLGFLGSFINSASGYICSFMSVPPPNGRPVDIDIESGYGIRSTDDACDSNAHVSIDFANEESKVLNLPNTNADCILRYSELMTSLNEECLQLLDAFLITRQVYMFGKTMLISKLNNSAPPPLHTSASTGEEEPVSNRHAYPVVTDPANTTSYESLLREHSKRVWDDCNRHGLKNISPRGGFVYRLTAMVEDIVALGDLLLDTHCEDPHVGNICIGKKFSMVQHFRETVRYFVGYCYECWEFWKMVGWAMAVGVGLVSEHEHNGGNTAKFYAELKRWLQPLKLSLALTGALLFVILKQLSSQSFARNSIWAAVAVAIVRRENTASSFLVSSQRLIGTVVGAVFAFAVFEAFACDADSGSRNKCGHDMSFPIMLSWLFVCGLFREGVNYGMASVAAGFTPLVLFLGQTRGTAEGAWLRVEMNIFGVILYLLVDVLIQPNRADTQLQCMIYTCCVKSHQALEYTVVGLKLLIDDHILQAADKDKEIDAILMQSQGEPLSDQLKARVIKLHEETYAVSPPESPVDADTGENDSLGSQSGSDTEDFITLSPKLRRRRKHIHAESEVSHSECPSESQPESQPPSISQSQSSVLGSGVDHIEYVMELTRSRSRNERTLSVSELPGELEEASRGCSSPQSIEIAKSREKFKIFWENIFKCEDNCFRTQLILYQLNDIALAAQGVLPLCGLEPQFSRKTFPSAVYDQAIDCFLRIMRSGTALTNGIKALSNILTRLRSKDALLCVDIVGYLAREVIRVSEHAATAWSSTLRVLSSVLQQDGASSYGSPEAKLVDSEDMVEIVLLARVCDKSQMKLDDYFRKIYFNRLDIINLNPQFLAAWMNFYESMTAWIEEFSKLGIALRNIRNVELYKQ